MEDNPLRTLKTYGQSVWLDLLRRSLITGGMLERLVDEDGLSGITSNPKIFDKAIEGSDDYDADLRALHAAGHDTARIQRELMITDIQLAADVLRPVYERTGGGDGFVSLEVSPHLARDTAGTVREAGELWEAVDRPNLLIKIPATVEGLPAIRRCLAAGININVTLLFGLSRYRQVAEAYLQGLEDRLGAGQPVDRIASVASFFLSRIDVLVDRLLEEIEQQDGPRGRRRQVAQQLRGRVAIASARAAHAIYREIVGGDRFRALERRGARPQRLLWASTSTKNPEYSDVKYVEALIGPDTVNTMPLETLDAYRDHGRPAPRLEGEEAGPHATLATLTEIGIDIDRVTEQLEEEGIEKFVTPHDRLLEAIGDKRRRLGGTQQLDRQLLELGEAGREVRARLEQLGRERFGERLWRREPDLWTSAPAAQETVLSGLGWLHVADTMAERLGELHAFSEQVRRDGFERIVHMGMGGSSLTPLVL
ncbi:MAG: transaldolase, partial [Candidatus Eiseniibacteriota bacterium]